MGAQADISRIILESEFSLAMIARATGLNYELLRRSVNGERKMTADEYGTLFTFLKSKHIRI